MKPDPIVCLTEALADLQASRSENIVASYREGYIRGMVWMAWLNGVLTNEQRSEWVDKIDALDLGG